MLLDGVHVEKSEGEKSVLTFQRTHFVEVSSDFTTVDAKHCWVGESFCCWFVVVCVPNNAIETLERFS